MQINLTYQSKLCEQEYIVQLWFICILSCRIGFLGVRNLDCLGARYNFKNLRKSKEPPWSSVKCSFFPALAKQKQHLKTIILCLVTWMSGAEKVEDGCVGDITVSSRCSFAYRCAHATISVLLIWKCSRFFSKLCFLLLCYFMICVHFIPRFSHRNVLSLHASVAKTEWRRIQ